MQGKLRENLLLFSEWLILTWLIVSLGFSQSSISSLFMSKGRTRPQVVKSYSFSIYLSWRFNRPIGGPVEADPRQVVDGPESLRWPRTVSWRSRCCPWAGVVHEGGGWANILHLQNVLIGGPCWLGYDFKDAFVDQICRNRNEYTCLHASTRVRTNTCKTISSIKGCFMHVALQLG